MIELSLATHGAPSVDRDKLHLVGDSPFRGEEMAGVHKARNKASEDAGERHPTTTQTTPPREFTDVAEAIRRRDEWRVTNVPATSNSPQVSRPASKLGEASPPRCVFLLHLPSVLLAISICR